VFFSVFLRVVIKSLYLAISGLFGRVPGFGPSALSARLAVCLSCRGALCLFRACRLPFVALARFGVFFGGPVAVSVGVGCRVSGLVCQGSDLEQVFDKPVRTSVRNRCSKVKSEGFSKNLPESLTES
jgi:hypothetical protein